MRRNQKLDTEEREEGGKNQTKHTVIENAIMISNSSYDNLRK